MVHVAVLDEFKSADAGTVVVKAVTFGAAALLGYFATQIIADVIVRFVPQLAPFAEWMTLAVALVLLIFVKQAVVQTLAAGSIAYSAVSLATKFLGGPLAGVKSSVEGVIR